MDHRALVFLIVAIVVFTLVHTFIFVTDISAPTGAAYSGFVNDRLISISAPDMYGLSTITGQAGAVEPYAKVIITNLQNREQVYTYADEAGSFQMEMIASGLDYLRIETE
ncbi:hypothetical protein KY335_03265 [Candidatus Woesearchaeota archaeon]|nr:hypothetical protein [Candidatus Woesearchaeota archaeon]